AASATFSVSDGTTSTATITIPFVSLSASQTNVSLPANGNVQITFTETASTGGTPTMDTKVFASTNCGSTGTISPSPVGFGTGNPLTANAIPFTTSAVSSGPQCVLNVQSALHPSLGAQVTFSLPAGIGVGVN